MNEDQIRLATKSGLNILIDRKVRISMSDTDGIPLLKQLLYGLSNGSYKLIEVPSSPPASAAKPPAKPPGDKS